MPTWRNFAPGSSLVDSYRLATKEPPPAGYILVHNRPDSRAFRAWWAEPGEEFVFYVIADGAPISGSTTASNVPALSPNVSGDAGAGPAA